MLLVDSEAASTYRGGILAASLLTAVMVAALPGPSSAFVRLFQLRPLAWIGERSYGIYLWHWPILVIAIAAFPAGPLEQDPPLTTVLVVLGATMVASAASFRWIETPIRRDGFTVTWARIRRTLRPRQASLLVPRVGLAALLSVVALAAVGVATAPDKSAAQLSGERGERAIERQAPSAPGSTSVPPGAGTTPPDPTSSSAPEPEGAWPTELAVPPGDRIVALGDSVLSGAAPSVYERFPGIFIDATPILQWREAPAMVQAMIDAGTMRDVVILNFGTNAGLKEAHSEQALRDVLDALGPDRRVVLVTVGGVSYWIPETNDRLRAISAEYPNTIVADWYAIIADRPDLLHRDRTHPTSEGTRVYADLLASTLEDLGPR
jgi:lysophospholipase L1-like esterase